MHSAGADLALVTDVVIDECYVGPTVAVEISSEQRVCRIAVGIRRMGRGRCIDGDCGCKAASTVAGNQINRSRSSARGIRCPSGHYQIQFTVAGEIRRQPQMYQLLARWKTDGDVFGSKEGAIAFAQVQ